MQSQHLNVKDRHNEGSGKHLHFQSEIRNIVSSNICITRNQISYSHSHQRNRQIRVWINPTVLNNRTTRSDRRRVRNPEPLRTNLYKSIQCDGLKPLKTQQGFEQKKSNDNVTGVRPRLRTEPKKTITQITEPFFCFCSEDRLQ